MTGTREPVEEVRARYEAGLYVQAYEAARRAGPEGFRGTSARLLWGRLLRQVGAPRAGTLAILRAWRADRGDPEALYYRAHMILEAAGPFRLWSFLEEIGDLPDAPAPIRADWFRLRARALAHLRDFESAHEWMRRAAECHHQGGWAHVEETALLLAEDRYDEALAVARRGVAERPFYRPAVEVLAHALTLVGRDDETVELLEAACERLECASLEASLAALHHEHDRPVDARRHLERAAARLPAMEPAVFRQLAAHMSQVVYACGDLDFAARLARAVGDPLALRFAERMERPVSRRRVRLAVPFVRQHHKTCSPATLAALSAHFSRPAEHLSVAEEICLDGTPAHSERRWAEEHGFAVAEFRVTWESAVALLDRGVPFTLTLVQPGAAHLVAAVGYDACRRTLLCRDPSVRFLRELDADGLFEAHAPAGPRGMAMVPREDAGRLAGLSLPDAELHDRLNEVHRALDGHDRDRAAAVARDLATTAPDHPLTWQARRALAAYDADAAALLEAAQALLAHRPDDVNLLLARLAALRELGRDEERKDLLRRLASSPLAEPLLRRTLAEELAADARERAWAEHLLVSALSRRPDDAGAYHALAELAWTDGRRTLALELFRFAACLEETHEGFALTYFGAARALGRTDEALARLRRRFERRGDRTGLPARVLARAHELLEDVPRALEALEAGLARRPDDGPLLLSAADLHARVGDSARARDLLENARPHVRRVDWLRVAAALEEYRGEHAQALALRREIVALQPLDVDAQAHVARLIAATEGRPAARAHLEALARRFPQNLKIARLVLEWIPADEREARLDALTRMIEAHPTDAWARRQQAVELAYLGRNDEAMAALEASRALEPGTPAHLAVLGFVLRRSGHDEEARVAWREALKLDVNAPAVIAALGTAHDAREARRAELDLVLAELRRQVVFGDAIDAYFQVAANVVPDDELLAQAEELRSARTDLPAAWSCVVRQLARMGRHAEAARHAREAALRFPLRAETWLDLAQAHRGQQDDRGEREALETACRLRPGWGPAERELARAALRAGDVAGARRAAERWVRHAPLDPEGHETLARILWVLGERADAEARLRHALRLEPGARLRWPLLAAWLEPMGRGAEARAFARTLAEEHPGDDHLWLAIAELCPEDAVDERLEAIERALRLDPRNVDAHDLRAVVLGGAGRFEEAAAACRPAVFFEPPLPLRGRAIWLRARAGDVTGAVDEMRALVAEVPDYAWGQRCLIEWSTQIERPELRAEAARQLAHAFPDDPSAWLALGQARQAARDERGAVEAFRRAAALAPEDDSAGLALVDALIDAGEYDEARAALDRVAPLTAPPLAGLRRVRLGVCRGRRDEAFAAWETIVSSRHGDAILAASNLLVRAGFEKDLLSRVDRAIETSEAPEELGAVWIQAGGSRVPPLGLLRLWRRLAGLVERGAAGVTALATYVEDLADRRRRFLLACFTALHRALLRRHTVAWGAVGYARLVLRRYRAVARWMYDWRERDGLRPYMLFNLASALRFVGRDREAAQVGHAALMLPPDTTVDDHRLWLAFDAARAGDRIRARALMSPLLGTERHGGWLRPALRTLIEVLLVAWDDSRPRAKRHTEAARRFDIALAVTPALRQRPEGRRLASTAARAVRRALGGVRGLAFWIRRF